MDASKLADPAHATVLKTAEGNTRQEISQETGIEEERTGRILENLQGEDLIRPEVEDGRRIFHVEGVDEKLEELKEELKGKLIGGTRKAVEEGNFVEAKDFLLTGSADDVDTRQTVIELEAAYRLQNL